MTGTVSSYDPATGTLVVNVTSTSGSGTYSSWTSNAYAPGPHGNYLNLQVNGGSFASFLNGVKGESAWDAVVVGGNQTYNYNVPTLILTPSTTVASDGNTQTVAFTTFLNDATAFMGGNLPSNQSAMWTALGADSNGVANGSRDPSSGLYISGVLVNIRPGIAIKNSGAITIQGDATNPNGIDLSGSAYSGSVLNTGDSQSLNGHFGQYDEPIVLAIRAGGNLNFGSCTGNCVTSSTSGTPPVLGSLSDGFTQNPASGPVYGLGSEVAGAGASGAATLFDPAAPGAYSGLSGGLGADSATYFLTAGADLSAANPLTVNPKSNGTLTVAGLPGDPLGQPSRPFQMPSGLSYATTADPLMLPASTFPTHGGNLTLTVGGNITGDMNANVTYPGGNGTYAGTDQELPYEMTGLGSQLKLQNWYL